LFKGFATVGILALGGILVIEQAISLGQLVAAEIIIILILGAMEKLISQFDMYYDLVAALDKLSSLTELPLERTGGLPVQDHPSGGTVDVRSVGFSYGDHEVLTDVTFVVKAGERVSLVGASGAWKSTLAQIMLGLEAPSHGSIEVNGIDTRVADLHSLRARVGYVFPENQIIPGTVLDNITLGRSVSQEDLQWTLRMAHLSESVRDLSNGLGTLLSATGENLSFGMRRRILFARMILSKPDVLIIDEAFEGIEDGTKLSMLDDLMSWPHWTIINISHDPEVVHRTSYVHVLQDGRISESGSPDELHSKAGTFCSLFPVGGHHG
ncbi:MAG: ATP-binding cassette domain-containing protein, partial [Candidatus Kapabacteria bacterium]|nr:ATP-binding cassette domain-containing protein [Candidatus Kapabacteria bacterium]